MKNGFVKVAAASPVIRVADADYNAERVIEVISSAAQKGVKVLVFPELTLTGCSCYDLFTHRVLLDGAREALLRVAETTADFDLLAFVGLPLAVGAKVYNVAAALYHGEILAFIPAEGTLDDGVNTLNSNGIYGEDKNSIDAIFLGDSIVYAGVSPLQIWNEYGIPTYCCSTSAQKLWYSEDMLRKAFVNQSPKLVMMETDALFSKFNFDDSLMHKAEGVFPVLQYHDRWKVFAENTFGDRSEVTSTNEYKGYKFSLVIKPSTNLTYMKQKLSVETLPSRNKSYLKEIKEYCEEHGAKLVLS